MAGEEMNPDERRDAVAALLAEGLRLLLEQEAAQEERLSEACRRCGAGIDHPADEPGVDPELCWECHHAALAQLDPEEEPAPPMREDDIRRRPRYRPFRRPGGAA